MTAQELSAFLTQLLQSAARWGDYPAVVAQSGLRRTTVELWHGQKRVKEFYITVTDITDKPGRPE